jgi:predicted secreted protein
MKLTSILAIYALFWVFSAFLVLPFGVKTHDEVGIAKIPGQAESAPANFSPKRIAVRATVVATVCFALYYANYVQGWLTVKDLDFFGNPPSVDGTKTD